MDLSSFSEVQDPFTGMVVIFINGGWVLFAMLGVEMMRKMWLLWRQGIWESKIKYNLLAIDVPKLNEQSPKALEQFFDHITGIDKTPTLQERYLEGFNPTRISFELVSIGGYIQFLIRTPTKFRDLVEAALYAEYPDAEITEVEDYIDGVPKPDEFASNWPNMDWNFWGCEMSFYKPDPYPVRTWMEFEHMLSKELKDPMGSLLEILSRLNPEEQVWIQWVIQTDNKRELQTKAEKLVKKIIGEQTAKKGNFILDIPRLVAQGTVESMTASVIDPTDFSTTQAKESQTMKNRLLQMTPGEINVLQSIERKAAKSSFKVRARLLYFGKKDIFSKAKGISGVYGGIKQFNTQNMNGFAPVGKSKTEAWYFLTRYRTRERMRVLLAGYRSRSAWAGHKMMLMNTEELATVWHFPIETVKAQLVQRTESKKSAAPTALPLEREVESSDVREAVVAEKMREEEKRKVTQSSPPPENLPFS